MSPAVGQRGLGPNGPCRRVAMPTPVRGVDPVDSTASTVLRTMSADVPPEMRAIPPGSVSLSDRRTGRVWSVELQPYELAAVPVTQAQYLSVTGLAPSA